MFNNGCTHLIQLLQPETLLDQFGWEIFYYPPYNLDLTLSDFFLFIKLKEFLDRKYFGSDDKLKNAVKNWLNALATANYNEGILKLMDRYCKNLNEGDDYVEKYTVSGNKLVKK